MNPDFLTTIAPPIDTVDKDPDAAADHGAPSIYDEPPAGATQSQEPINGDVDPFPDSYRTHPNAPRPPAPAPMIFTVPTGGIALDAGTITNPAGTKVVTVGGQTEGRPDIMGIALLCTSGAGTVEVLPNGSPDTLGAGFLLPVAGATILPVYLPIRRANLRLTGAVNLSFLVISAALSQGR